MNTKTNTTNTNTVTRAFEALGFTHDSEMAGDAFRKHVGETVVYITEADENDIPTTWDAVCTLGIYTTSGDYVMGLRMSARSLYQSLIAEQHAIDTSTDDESK